MKNIVLIVSIAIAALLVMFALSNGKSNKEAEIKGDTAETVLQEGDIQVINVISTSGGYFPQNITAKAEKETLLRIESKNSYGCERSFRIPKLDITEILPQQGITEFQLGTPSQGEKILGTCSMGMYTFTIRFE